jgi:hypothetical protein
VEAEQVVPPQAVAGFLDGLTGIVTALDRGEVRFVAVETPAPSPTSWAESACGWPSGQTTVQRSSQTAKARPSTVYWAACWR